MTTDTPQQDEAEKPFGELRIVRIRRGKGARSKWIYAELHDENGRLLISATLDFIVKRLERGNFLGPV